MEGGGVLSSVAILTHSFLDAYNGRIDKIYGGGLERYLYELCLLLRKLGAEPEVYQLAFRKPFETRLKTTELAGMKVHGLFCGQIEKVAEIFEEMSRKAAAPIIYASCIWHPIRYVPGSLGICHGINWDRTDLVTSAKTQVADNVQRALNELWRIVSVDSHFLTYCRSVCHYFDPLKVELIPNSVDTSRFYPGERKEQGRTGLKVLFPRRISHERGILPMMVAADALLERFPDLQMQFVGETIEDADICRAFLFWLSCHPHRARITHEVKSFDEMRLVYADADIAVIPTVYSEGTSLSCLEAMSSGLPVVATNVGGLNDLILDGYNGRLVPPSAERITAALIELIEDREMRKALGIRARETARCFDKNIWAGRWERVLKEYLRKEEAIS